MTQQEILEVIVKALDSKRAEDIQVLHVGELTILGDYFIIANGTSTTHTKTLADEVEYQLSERGLEPMHRERPRQRLQLDRAGLCRYHCAYFL